MASMWWTPEGPAVTASIGEQSFRFESFELDEPWWWTPLGVFWGGRTQRYITNRTEL